MIPQVIQHDVNNPNMMVRSICQAPALLMLKTKSLYQKAWLWLADILLSAKHSQAFC